MSLSWTATYNKLETISPSFCKYGPFLPSNLSRVFIPSRHKMDLPHVERNQSSPRTWAGKTRMTLLDQYGLWFCMFFLMFFSMFFSTAYKVLQFQAERFVRIFLKHGKKQIMATPPSLQKPWAMTRWEGLLHIPSFGKTSLVAAQAAFSAGVQEDFKHHLHTIQHDN